MEALVSLPCEISFIGAAYRIQTYYASHGRQAGHGEQVCRHCHKKVGECRIMQHEDGNAATDGYL